ncbi:hypothetical protein Q3A66_01665 [Hymenobacter sp. BT770]|uniref:hypothetical protein n=1 Tax=Hymenobacter sp. BT770 TaxID=2886942 RepID=UPI001D12130C|nr:hypothetical protein [Hymenobacter sp. BT770]MCC3151663.1 hypothetical protein [Hymenobacter sp. BT770]MDO3413759.1 hypothetical protein [Hymenobacter sp. BT770]
MNKRYLVVLLALFAVLDTIFTFGQYCQQPLDGDLAAIVVPSAWYRPVLHDPFGWAVLTQNAVYAAPNRFFAHAAMVGYLRYVPRWLHAVASPIDSIYLAGALFKTGVHVLLLVLLAAYVRLGSPGTWGRRGWWLAVALLVPLFQTAGFYGQMGLVSRSLTYSFFYEFPVALLLVLLLPFYRAACRQQPVRLGWLPVVAWLGLAVVLAFNGPVVPAATAVLFFGIGVHWLWQQWQRQKGEGPGGPVWLSGQAMGLLGIFAGLCAYSLFIGRNNAENAHPFTLWELYQRVPQGIFDELTSKLGLPLLVAFVLSNAWLVRRFTPPSAEGRRVRQVLRWVGLFAVVYIALLPLGGYRPYRPYILRNDSILPVLLGLLFAYALSTVYLLQQLPARSRRWYVGAVCVLSFIFINADRRLWLRDGNACERQALAQLAAAPAGVVRLPADCTVLGWLPITDFRQSAYNAELLYYWGVTPGRRLYYQ